MWKRCNYSKSQIDKAGRMLISNDISREEYDKCLKIIDSFRAAHAFPMNTFAINLKHKVDKIPSAVVVQRLKRLETIEYKLKRYPDMRLSRVQDLGGCRVIVPSVEDVYSLVQNIRNSRIRHIEHNYKDYIAIPNPNTGYRGYHLIYKYNSDRNEDYNGLLIEVQIRTELQHLWATAVETVGLFTDNKLKFNKGSKEWIEFFKLTSALFSIEENSAIVDNVPTDVTAIYKKWILLMKELKVIKTLAAIGITAQNVGHITKTNIKGYYLIKLDSAKKTIDISIFKGTEKSFEVATNAYNKLEKESTDRSINCVLVSATSYENLITAYPNYFFDVSKFLDTIIKIIKKYRTNNQG